LSVFKSDVESLQNLSLQIDSFLSSEKLLDLEQSSSKVSVILRMIDSKKNELQEIEPRLRSLARAVDDQERHKKLLMMNIDILEADERRKVLENEIRNLKAERDQIDGGSTAYDEFVALRGEKENLLQKKSNYEGRFSSYVEQIRALKVRCFSGRIF
jgi:DNA repair exonuclease SbcCD ATPase subunit